MKQNKTITLFAMLLSVSLLVSCADNGGLSAVLRDNTTARETPELSLAPSSRITVSEPIDRTGDLPENVDSPHENSGSSESNEKTDETVPPDNGFRYNAPDSLAEYDICAEHALADMPSDPAEKLRTFLDTCSPVNIMLSDGTLGTVYYHGMSSPDEALSQTAAERGVDRDSLTVSKPFVSVYYLDLDTGYEFGYNEDAVTNCASLAKTPYMLAVLEEIQSYNDTHTLPDGTVEYTDYTKKYDLSEVWKYDPKTMFRPGSGVIFEMDSGVEFTWRELFVFSFADSDNIAFGQLREHFGYTYYNELITELGTEDPLKGTCPMSARGCGLILRRAYSFITGGSENGKFMRDSMIAATKQNNIIGRCMPDTTVCHKYGWDIGAYHDSAIVFDDHPYIVVIMTDYDTGGYAADTFCTDAVKMIMELHESIHTEDSAMP